MVATRTTDLAIPLGWATKVRVLGADIEGCISNLFEWNQRVN